MTNDPMDELIVVRCQLGDREAWRELVARWHRPVWTFLWRMVGDGGRSDDLAQEVWVRAVRNLPQLEAPDRFPAWLFTLARRVMHDELRRTYRRVETDPDVAPEDAAAAIDDDGVAELLDRLEVERALGSLEPRDRETAALFHLGELTIDDVARVLEIPTGTVKSRLHRARQQLSHELGDDEEMPR